MAAYDFYDDVIIQRPTCKNCNHYHNYNKGCHTFISIHAMLEPSSSEDSATSSADSDDSDDSENQTESSEISSDDMESTENDDDENDELGMINKAKKRLANLTKGKGDRDEIAMRRANMPKYNTPEWATDAGLKRCPCLDGIPFKSNLFRPVKENRYVKKFDNVIKVRWGDAEEVIYTPKLPPSFEILDFVIPWLDAKTQAKCEPTCQLWSEKLLSYTPYYDIKKLENEYTQEACNGQVFACLYLNNYMYVSGNKQVRVYDMNTGEFHCTAFRDVCQIVFLLNDYQYMYSFGSNGSIRKWNFAHDPRKTSYEAGMWEHAAYITDAKLSKPSQGFCKLHAIENHSCQLYSCSDDRCAKMWDTVENKCLHTFTPPARGCASLTAVAATHRHFIVASSKGYIWIMAKWAVCERDDLHMCSTIEHGHQQGCVQTFVKHDDWRVTALLIAGPEQEEKWLYSGAYDGSIYCWRIPTEGYEYELHQKLPGHFGVINRMINSYQYMYSASDDGTIRVWDMSINKTQKTLDCYRAVKAISYVASDECSYLLAGIIDGNVMMYRAGTAL